MLDKRGKLLELVSHYFILPTVLFHQAIRLPQLVTVLTDLLL